MTWIDEAAESIAKRFLFSRKDRDEVKGLIETAFWRCPICGGSGVCRVEILHADFKHECEACRGSGTRKVLF